MASTFAAWITKTELSVTINVGLYNSHQGVAEQSAETAETTTYESPSNFEHAFTCLNSSVSRMGNSEQTVSLRVQIHDRENDRGDYSAFVGVVGSLALNTTTRLALVVDPTCVDKSLDRLTKLLVGRLPLLNSLEIRGVHNQGHAQPHIHLEHFLSLAPRLEVLALVDIEANLDVALMFLEKNQGRMRQMNFDCLRDSRPLSFLSSAGMPEYALMQAWSNYETKWIDYVVQWTWSNQNYGLRHVSFCNSKTIPWYKPGKRTGSIVPNISRDNQSWARMAASYHLLQKVCTKATTHPDSGRNMRNLIEVLVSVQTTPLFVGEYKYMAYWRDMETKYIDKAHTTMTYGILRDTIHVYLPYLSV